MGSEKRMGYHILLSNIYAEEEESENVLQNEVGCSWVEISGFVNCFVSRDEKHPQSSEIYYMLDMLTLDMKYAGYKPQYSSNLNTILDSGE